ncbi:TIGR02206 family membrane protein [Haloferula sp.]|uniref:YwaF family protein n=1 Tax=Haloferula sp. TaxID=2497595 RepID=UPI0032A05730
MPDPVFTPFSAQHGATVVAGISGIALLLWLGRRGGKCERITRTCLAFVNLGIFGFSQWAWSQVQREVGIDNAVPLHLCDLAAFFAGFALITGHRTCALLTYFWGLAGTIQGILTPATDIGFPHPAYFSFFIHHFAVIAAAIYLPVVMKWRIETPFWRSPLKAFGWVNVYVIVAIIANKLLGTNYGFLAGKPDNPSVLDHLPPHPGYIIWLELIALALFFLLALPVRSRPSKPQSTST